MQNQENQIHANSDGLPRVAQNSTSQLPGQYLHYQAPFRLLNGTKKLFKVLFMEWKTCLMCIMKIYCIQYPRIYSDSEFLAFMLKKILIQDNHLQTTVPNSQTQQQFFKKYNSTQKIYDCQNCWLCQQLFQKKYLNELTEKILQNIKTKNYVNYEKYKLNIKTPLIYTLKYYLVCFYLWHKFSTDSANQQCQINTYKVSKQELAAIQRVLKVPYEKLSPKFSNNPILQVKVVQKWLISNQINTQTSLQSTIQQLEDMLTINIEHDYQNYDLQDNLMKLFNHLVGLQKKTKSRNQRFVQKPQKKVKIDLSHHQDEENQQNQQKREEQQGETKKVKNQSFRCIANNVNKILYLKYDEMKHILYKFKEDKDLFSLFKPLENVQILKERVEFINQTLSISRTIKLQTKNICLSGKYCKYSRYISQTPWIVDGVKLTEGSLQEQIQGQILHLFYPGVPKQKMQTKFHSGGRQDIDVRMLKGGRPFVLQLVNPILRIKDLNLQKIIEGSNLSLEVKKKIYEGTTHFLNQKQKITFALQNIVNHSTQLVQIKDFQEADESYISVQLKKAQIQKIKHYVCYIVSEQQLTEKDRQIVEAVHDLQLEQKTPLRVLHRRTLMIRKKIIHRIYMHQVTKHSAIIQLWASAGTYIKEFIHGDLQRTLPNFGSLTGKNVDILQLDVGSLKQGNWEKGDDLKMKLENFQWKD